jgi:hypothetical protein
MKKSTKALHVHSAREKLSHRSDAIHEFAGKKLGPKTKTRNDS